METVRRKAADQAILPGLLTRIEYGTIPAYEVQSDVNHRVTLLLIRAKCYEAGRQLAIYVRKFTDCL